MSGQRRLDRHVGRLEVADLADKDDVRVLADNAAQARSEREADLRPDLYLADPGHLVFNGIFDGDDVLVRRINPLQSGVERRRFARPRGAGYKDNAVGTLDETANKRIVVGIHTEFFEAEQECPFLEDTHDNPFAKSHRDNRDADVDFFAAQADLDAPVLRQTVFRNVEVGHDLDPRDDGRLL